MCGIAGIFVTDSAIVDTQQIGAAMQSKLRHRGPDDLGAYASADRRCALTHTRLAIIDRSAGGHQPMTSSDGRYTLVLNGEIYNFAELRRNLEMAGSRFRSGSDSEVVLQLFVRQGIACLPLLRGMFALSIWDESEQRLLVARDHFGIKPLYYFANDAIFLFASEVRALLATGLVPRRLSHGGLANYLNVGSLVDPLTLVDGVQALLPGHYLTVTQSGSRIAAHRFDYPAHESCCAGLGVPDNYADAATHLRQLLDDSVRRHLVGDVPVGVFLSGGIDSSAIVALIRQLGQEAPKTFSVAFAEKDYSEAAHARLIAKRFGTNHREIFLSEQELCALIPAAIDAMDQPTMDGINTYVVAKAVKQAGATVALSGLGGDELFAGYPSFRRALRLRQLAAIPPAIRKGSAAVGRSALSNSSRRQKFWRMVASDCSAHAAYIISRELFSAADIQNLSPRLTCVAASIDRDGGGDAVNAMSNYELHGYMANTLLRDTDQMSMAHGLEVRVPFVDRELTKYVLSLPGAWKVAGQRPKPLLLDALSGLIPESIWRRPKMGFTLPFERWLATTLRPAMESTLDRAEGRTAQGLRRQAVQLVWRTFLQNPRGEPWSRPWSLYVLDRWCEINQIEA